MFDLGQLERGARVVRRGDAADAGASWPLLSQRLGATVTVKHENHTPIGAFKVRGGLVYVDRAQARAAATSPD